MKTWMILGVLVCLIAGDAFGQTDQENLEKYWLYRQRLKEDFVKVGPDPGMSIPAEVFNPVMNIQQSVEPTIVWSDGGHHLGYYIAVLATEYRLLVDNGYDPNLTIKELYFALNALWRLDATSDDFSYDINQYSTGQCTTAQNSISGPMNASNFSDPTILDGFFMRDDVPVGFDVYFPNASRVSSDLLSIRNNNCLSKEMSQDQGIYVILGLFAVTRFVDPWISFNGVNLRTFSIYEGMKIVEAMKGAGNWVLKNPNTGQPTLRGSSGVFWGYPKAELGNRLSGGSPNFHNYNSIQDAAGWDGQTLLNYVIASMKSEPGQVNLGQGAAMAAVCNCWNSTQDGLALYATKNKELYLLFNELVHAPGSTYSNSRRSAFKQILDTAPCEGPSSPWPSNGIFGWTSRNRFFAVRHKKVDIDQDGKKEPIDTYKTGNVFSDGQE